MSPIRFFYQWLPIPLWKIERRPSRKLSLIHICHFQLYGFSGFDIGERRSVEPSRILGYGFVSDGNTHRLLRNLKTGSRPTLVKAVLRQRDTVRIGCRSFCFVFEIGFIVEIFRKKVRDFECDRQMFAGSERSDAYICLLYTSISRRADNRKDPVRKRVS